MAAYAHVVNVSFVNHTDDVEDLLDAVAVLSSKTGHQRKKTSLLAELTLEDPDPEKV